MHSVGLIGANPYQRTCFALLLARITSSTIIAIITPAGTAQPHAQAPLKVMREIIIAKNTTTVVMVEAITEYLETLGNQILHTMVLVRAH